MLYFLNSLNINFIWAPQNVQFLTRTINTSRVYNINLWALSISTYHHFLFPLMALFNQFACFIRSFTTLFHVPFVSILCLSFHLFVCSPFSLLVCLVCLFAFLSCSSVSLLICMLCLFIHSFIGPYTSFIHPFLWWFVCFSKCHIVLYLFICSNVGLYVIFVFVWDLKIANFPYGIHGTHGRPFRRHFWSAAKVFLCLSYLSYKVWRNYPSPVYVSDSPYYPISLFTDQNFDVCSTSLPVYSTLVSYD